MSDLVGLAVTAYRDRFGEDPEVVTRAPGRVNLIGEHTDYNEGFVLPAAIDRWVVLACGPAPDEQTTIWSIAHRAATQFLTTETHVRQGGWPDYPLGVLTEFQKLGLKVAGFRAVMAGDVPVGAGLSSSAAVEMAVIRALLDLNGHDLSGPEAALLGQRAENGFVGVNCGIMDQFVSANGQAGHALFLDCRDLSYRLLPLPDADCRIVICNSGVERGLTGSAYNQRRAVSEEVLATYREALSDVTYCRCRHVVGEIARTQQAANLLGEGDLEGFGLLMGASHASLREDYEVSGSELDALVDIADGVPGVMGARMTGAGFGGCTVNLVREEAVQALTETVTREYPARSGLEAEVYVCNAVDGAERLDV